MSNLNVGIIGLGWGQLQIEAFRRVRGVEISALCDQDPVRLAEVAGRYKIKNTHANWVSLIQSNDVDLISIATPPETHHEIARAAMTAGKHVICEKPLALDVRDAEELSDLAGQRGIVHALDHEMRFLPAIAYAKELIDEDYLGGLLRAEVTMTLEQPWGREHGNWAADDDRGGGILLELGLHFLDILGWWFGDVSSVFAERQTHFPAIRIPNESDNNFTVRSVTGDDAFWCVMRFARGGEAIVHFISGARHEPGWTMNAYGVRGALVVQDGGLLGKREVDREMMVLPIPKRLELGDNPRDPLMWSMTKLFERVTAKINRASDVRPFPDFSDGVRVMKLIQAIRRASQEKTWVNV